jgi:bifunctional DNA-binding transcriptional regulator/antitoxin component of YhaV-PrlF toxin-antitoxin module
MPTLTITAKGQVTLKKELLEHLGARPGDRVSAEILPGGGIAIRPFRPTGRITDAFGFLDHKIKRRLSLEEISTIIEEGWAGKR